MHICYGYGIPANIEWKAALGDEWRQYEKFFPALAKSRIDQVSVECINSHVPMSVLTLLDGKDVLIGVIDVATEKIETPEEVAAVINEAAKHVPAQKIVASTNCGMAPDAPRNRRIEARSTGAGRGAGTQEQELIFPPSAGKSQPYGIQGMRSNPVGSIFLKFSGLDGEN